MILGVEHIALSANELSDGVELLERNGYKTRFVQRDVPNPSAKKNLLRTFEKFHSVAYCQIQDGPSIELTQHSPVFRTGLVHSPYQVLFSGQPVQVEPLQEQTPVSWKQCWVDVFGEDVSPVRWKELGAQFWHTQPVGSESHVVKGVMLPVGDIETSKNFWCNGLGCREINRGLTAAGNNWLHIGFRSFVKAWCLELILVQAQGGIETPYLDDSGFPCLALISNRMPEDLEKIGQYGGHEITGKFQLEMNNQMLTIAMARGCNGELIELIEFNK